MIGLVRVALGVGHEKVVCEDGPATGGDPSAAGGLLLGMFHLLKPEKRSTVHHLPGYKL